MDCSRPKTRNVDEWLDEAPDFSRPICAELRELFLQWEPDLTEAIKWNMLCFSGRKLVCGLSACKAHVGVAFFRGTELPDPAGLFTPEGEMNTNIRGIRFTKSSPIHQPALKALLHAAAGLDADPEILPAPKSVRAPLPPPEFFVEALKKNRKASEGYARLSASCQREYIVWLSSAKREETKAARLKQTLAALVGGRKWMDRKG
jgi:hypothetical protein